MSAWANHSIPHSLNKAPTVKKIIIRGLSRTKEIVVRRELLFKENQVLTPEALLASVQRLKNLRIFSKVLPYLALQKNNQVILTIDVVEKWTTIPYFSFSSGGDTFYAYAGIYDINSFGRYIETGIQYDNWNGKSGGTFWFRNPRFLHKRLLAGFNLGSTTRPWQLYTAEGEHQGKYILEKKMLNILFKKEFKIWLEAGITLGFREDKIVDSSPTEKIDANTLQLLTKRDKTRETSITTSLRVGKLNYDNYLVRGKQSTIYFKYADEKIGSDKTIRKIQWKNLIFWRLPFKGNFGLRFNAAAIDTQDIQNYFYIGGFENIRGYFDGQFRSKVYGQFNAEYRIPSFQHDWLVIQHIFFIDAVRTANNFNDFKTAKNIYSAGIGVRIISPRIYSFNGRIDIALFSSQKAASYISFGAQQFF
ncbi:MAG TPA: hypothetical protein ENJ28_09830 [Gammaproteobacteria bacterium]|nr:hypothetical protein [Gammaproteobacteria bacterium]